MNERDLGGETREEYSFLHGGVSAANHHDFLPGKEKAVAGGAGRNAVADEFLFVGQTQPAGRSAASDNECLRVNLVLSEMQQKRTLAEVDAGEMSYAIFRAKALGLLAHVLNELRSHDSFWKAGKIFHERSERELAARFVPFNHQRFQIGPRRIQRGGMSGAAGADDDDVAGFTHDWVMC